MAWTKSANIKGPTGPSGATTAPASGTSAGLMSASDYSKLSSSTATNTPSTLVQRDASGNFAATVITASLTGTASNATQLGGQAGSYYLDRTNHTGSQLASTISNFDSQVRTSRLDQMAAPTAAVAYNTQRITGLGDPTSAQDAATRNYVDTATGTLVTLTTVQTISGAKTFSAATTSFVAVAASGTVLGNGVYDGTSAIAANRVYSAANKVPLSGLTATGTTAATTFLRGDNTWSLISGISGLSPSAITGTAVITTDSRLSDARTPTAHAATHASGGTDPVTLAESQVTNLVADLAAKYSSTNLVPVPAGLSATGIASATTYLRGDGTWATPASGGGTTTTAATLDPFLLMGA